jgi:hypothetical protein
VKYKEVSIRVTVGQVLEWIRQALEVAERDEEGGRGIWIEPTPHLIFIVTYSDLDSTETQRSYHRITRDGVGVVWEELDIGLPTGADWLPEDFKKWLRGEIH